MSQHTNSGANAPRFSVGAGDEDGVGPCSNVNFTACSKLAVCFLPSTVRPVASILSIDVDRPPLGVHGVGQPVNHNGAACPSVSPKPLPFPVRSRHSSRRASSRSRSTASKLDALGVGQPAIPSDAT